LHTDKEAAELFHILVGPIEIEGFDTDEEGLLAWLLVRSDNERQAKLHQNVRRHEKKAR
jgi:hypothetical protein